MPEATVRKIFSTRSAKPVTALVWHTGLSMRVAFKIQSFVMKLAAGELLPARAGVHFPMTEDEMRWHLGYFDVASERRQASAKLVRRADLFCRGTAASCWGVPTPVRRYGQRSRAGRRTFAVSAKPQALTRVEAALSQAAQALQRSRPWMSNWISATQNFVRPPVTSAGPLIFWTKR